MAEYTYYCEVVFDRADVRPGVYSFRAAKNNFLGYGRVMTLSEKIWRQGPKGGVKIVKSRKQFVSSQYVTSDEKTMKEFMWVKLQAQPYGKGEK